MYLSEGGLQGHRWQGSKSELAPWPGGFLFLWAQGESRVGDGNGMQGRGAAVVFKQNQWEKVADQGSYNTQASILLVDFQPQASHILEG